MNATLSRSPKRKALQAGTWPRKVQPGRAIVTVYRRTTPGGNIAFMVANYSEGQRRFDSYPSESDALAAADTLARRLDKCDYVAASLTKDQAVEYANSAQVLAPFNISVGAATGAVAECLKSVGDLATLHAACRFYTARHKQTVKKSVREAVAELLAIKEARGASARYLQDLRYRLTRFAADCIRDCGNVTTADIQEWLDSQKLAPQGYTNFRRVLHLFFQFAVARGYAADNPIAACEKVKVRTGEIEIFTASDIARLLAAASPAFLPCLAIGAFAGLRSAEIERLEWSAVDLAERHIVVGASRAKTASRRIVPICENLLAWLTPYAGRQGLIWTGGHDAFYEAQQDTADATGIPGNSTIGATARKPVAWKSNALRHSYASYRFAQTGDAGRVAGELGNSAAVVHRHYRELVKPADAARWFAVKPEAPANVVTLAAANAGTN